MMYFDIYHQGIVCLLVQAFYVHRIWLGALDVSFSTGLASDIDNITFNSQQEKSLLDSVPACRNINGVWCSDNVLCEDVRCYDHDIYLYFFGSTYSTDTLDFVWTDCPSARLSSSVPRSSSSRPQLLLRRPPAYCWHSSLSTTFRRAARGSVGLNQWLIESYSSLLGQASSRISSLSSALSSWVLASLFHTCLDKHDHLCVTDCHLIGCCTTKHERSHRPIPACRPTWVNKLPYMILQGLSRDTPDNSLSDLPSRNVSSETSSSSLKCYSLTLQGWGRESAASRQARSIPR